MKSMYWAVDGGKKENRAETSVVDGELIARVLEGNPVAEMEFGNIVYALVKPVVFKCVPDRVTAEDVVQETVITVFCKLDTLQDVEKFPYWVKRVAINKARDWRRKRKELFLSELRKTEEGELEDIQIEDTDPDSIPGQTVIDFETAEEYKALAEMLLGILNQEQQDIVKMRYMDELKFQEIADRLGYNENTIKSRLRRATAKMAEKAHELQEEGGISLLRAA